MVRIAASLLGLLFASVLFLVFGFHIWTISLFILIVYPILARFNLKDGIVTCSVLVFHVFGQGVISIHVIVTEVCLLFIGLGTATLFNFVYMPKEHRKLQQLKCTVEELFSIIFTKLSMHLKDHSYIWSGEELIHADKAIEEGLTVAKRSEENQLLRMDTQPLIYFHMRRQQLESIQRMMDLVAQVYQNLPHGQLTAELFEELSVDVKSAYYTGKVESQLLTLEQKFKLMDLPQTRDEFEDRSALLQLCLELKHYLSIAKKKKPKQ
jgi:uncharacterized membrane protein YgaE (UPF0421/DUF939 family)